MSLTAKAQEIHTQVNTEGTKMGDLRKIAKEVKKDHDLALELWSTGTFFSRQLAILIMDKKMLSQDFIDTLSNDIAQHEFSQKTHLTDWLMANQLMKEKKMIPLIESWEDSHFPVQRRIFWYYQARLRWTGQTPPNNTEALLSAIEQKMGAEVPEVQWAMNFLAGWIGVFDESYRNRCIVFGEKLGLYKEEVAPKGCTPNYLPEFIRIEVNKREK